MDAVLEVKDLTIDFATPRGYVHALRNVSITVPRNKVVGVVGESGCGKSTLILAAINLLAANAEIRGGEVIYDERDVLAMSGEELTAIRGRNITMVFQDPMTALNPVLSIGTLMTDIQYREYGRSKADKRALAVEMLRRVGLSDPGDQLDRFPHQFSGGMRQRIAIAMALLTDPDLLIADEPTTALDVTLEAQIIHLLRELQEGFLQGSILFVSHNLGLVAELCDAVVVMYAGEVVETGSVRDVFHRPSHPYTQLLLECDPARILDSTRTLPTIRGGVPDLIRVPTGCVFAPRCPKAFDICGQKAPTTEPVVDGHSARCHLLANG